MVIPMTATENRTQDITTMAIGQSLELPNGTSVYRSKLGHVIDTTLVVSGAVAVAGIREAAKATTRESVLWGVGRYPGAIPIRLAAGTAPAMTRERSFRESISSRPRAFHGLVVLPRGRSYPVNLPCSCGCGQTSWGS